MSGLISKIKSFFKGSQTAAEEIEETAKSHCCGGCGGSDAKPEDKTNDKSDSKEKKDEE